MVDDRLVDPKLDDNLTKIADESVAGSEDRSVSVGGNITNGTIVTGSRNKVINFFLGPLFWQVYDRLNRYFKPRRPAIFVFLVVEMFALGFFLYYRHHFLIDGWIYLTAALLLAVTIWICSEHVITRNEIRPKTSRLLPTVFIAALIGFVGWQIWPRIFPGPIDEDRFGIAVAVFGEGAAYGATHRGYDAADRILGDLETVIDNQVGLRDRIELRRTGVVGTESDDAERVGERIKADLIIWGRIVVEGQSLRIHFEALRGPELIDNPDAPTSMPFTPVVLEGLFTLPYDTEEGFGSIVAGDRLAMAAFSMGLFHYFDQDWVSAQKQFEVARRHLDPDEREVNSYEAGGRNLGLVYYYLGKTRQLLGDFEGSEADFLSAMEHGLDEPALWLGRSFNHRAAGREPERIQALQKAIELTYDAAAETGIAAVYNRALAREAIPDYEGALREYQSIIEQDDTFFVAYLGAASTQIELDDYAGAAVTLDQAEELVDGRPVRYGRVHLLRGRLAQRQGDEEGAVAEYLLASEQVTGDEASRIYAPLIALYADRGDVENVVTYGKKLVEASDAIGWAHATYGRYLHNVGAYDLAIEELERALLNRPPDPSLVHMRLARSHVAFEEDDPIGAAKRAEEHFVKALERPGQYEAPIRAEYGLLLYKIGRLDDAIDQLERSIDLTDEPAITTRQNLGIFYEEADRLDAALAMYRSIVMHCLDEYPEKLDYAVERLQLYGEAAPPCHLIDGR